MTDAIIRQARSTDFALLARLNAEVQELHFSNRPDQFKPVCLSDIEQWFSDLFRNPDARVWIAEVDEAPAGYIAVLQQERGESPFCPARTWWEIRSRSLDEGTTSFDEVSERTGSCMWNVY